MAIYHLHIKIIGRSQGRSAIACAAYRRGTRLFDEREGKTWNYQNKSGVMHREISIPDNAPSWVNQLVETHHTSPNIAANTLWNLVEQSEKRIDAQLAREIEFALPIELTQSQNITLAREFIQDQFASRGMIADWSLHWDDGNPHVHVMLTMRELTQEGFGKKVTAWNHKLLLREWRQKWSEYTNFHLSLHQHDVRIDHRSYQDQGIELIASTHLGKSVTDMDRRGIATDLMAEANHIHRKNLSRIAKQPEILLDKITKQQNTFTNEQLTSELGRYMRDKGKFKNHSTESSSSDEILTPKALSNLFKQLEHHESVFTERDIAKALTAYTNHADLFTRALLQIRTSPQLLELGSGEDGRDRFTTRAMFEIENKIQARADELRHRGHHSISQRTLEIGLQRHLTNTGKTLTDEQLAAVKHITGTSAIRCLVGRAGTGKSFTLGAARSIWEESGSRVLGIALSGIASDGLTRDAGIPARTIESFRYAVQQGHLKLSTRDVVVMDEAGMTDSVSMQAVLQTITEARAKLVLVGDPDQLQPIGPGATFRALLERLGFAEIQTIYRQQHAWQREATAELAAGKIEEGLALYHQQNCLQIAKTSTDAMVNLVSAWASQRRISEKDIAQFLVMTHRNVDVSELNTAIRQHRIDVGEIDSGYKVSVKSGVLSVSLGDRLLFLKNDSGLGVKNGRFGTIVDRIIGESGLVLGLSVKLDGSDERIVKFNTENYSDFTLGYAATIHKVQGVTVDHAYVYAGKTGWNKNLTYVAMTRHRQSCHLFTSKDAYANLDELSRGLRRFALKDSLLDYPLAFAERRGIDTSSLSWGKKLAKRLSEFHKKLTERYQEWIDPAAYWSEKQAKISAVEKMINAQTRREDARHVAAYIDVNRECGIAWAALKEKMLSLGINEIRYGTAGFEVLSKLNEYHQHLQAIKKRDALASSLTKEPTRYELALNRYSISPNKIKQQASAHDRRTNERDYSTDQTPAITLDSLLRAYLDSESTQTKLVTAMNETRVSNPTLSQNYAQQAKSNDFQRQAIMSDIERYPETENIYKQMKQARPVELRTLGGIDGIQKRFNNNMQSTNDKMALIAFIRNKIQQIKNHHDKSLEKGRTQ